jgi:hypothetical protein
LEGIFWGGILGGKFWREIIFFWGGGAFRGKTHYACYYNVIGTVNISIILCSEREGMASSNKENCISETSTNSSHTSSVGTRKCHRNVCNANEVSYFSVSHNFDHGASNFIQHVPHESPKSEDFEGTDNEEEEYDGDKSSQQFNSNENNQNVGQSGDYDQHLNDWDENFPPSEEFERTDEDFQGTNENDEEIPSSGNFKSSEDDYDNGEPNSPIGEFKDNNVGDYDFPPSEDFEGTDEEFPPSEDFQGTNEDGEEFPPSGDFKSNDDDYDNVGQSFSNEEFKRNNVGADDFPQSEDFEGTDEDNEDFPPSEDFEASNEDEDDEQYLSSGEFQSSEDDYTIGCHSFPSDKLKRNNVDVDFPPSEDFQDTDDGFQGTKQDGGNFHSSGDFESNEDYYVNSGHNVHDYFSPNDYVDDYFSPNDYVDDDVLKHSAATNEGDRHSLVQSPDNVLLDTPYGDKEKPSSEDDEIVETLQRNIVSRTKIRPFYIDPKHSSYTRSRKEFLTKSISIKELISSECCQKNCLKSMDYMYALNKRKTYLAMNKSMQNSYLTGCMISTNTVYDYRIGNILLCRKAFKKIHSIGNLRLSRIQTRLEKDPSFYSKVHHGRESGPFTNTALSWMRDFFSKHGECMPDRDTIHIPDNFSRREIYNLYKGYAEDVEGKDNFITYAYFTRIWKKQFNNVRIPKKSRMGICSICATLKSRRDKSEGAERGMYLLFFFFFF